MEEALWNAYRANRNVENRNALAEFYWEFVQKEVQILAFQSHVPDAYYDDLFSNCVLRLFRAIELYNPKRNTKFTYFFAKGIQYAILDLQRKIHRNQKQVESSIESGVDISEYSEKVYGEKIYVADQENQIRKNEFWNAVFKQLSESERRILMLLYKRFQTYRQTGKTLCISCSTTHNMHTQILQQLRTKFSYEQLREIILDTP